MGCSKWTTSCSGHDFKPPAAAVGGKLKQRVHILYISLPSHQRRNTRCLAAFLEKKNYQKEQDHSSKSAIDAHCIRPIRDHVSATSGHLDNSLVVMFSNKLIIR